MNWIEHLEDLNKKIQIHINSQLDNGSNESMLVKFLCQMAQRNIALFMFGVRGSSKHSYVDIMKTAIRRQIELNQKATLPFIKKIDPIIDLWRYQLKKDDFTEIDKYWRKYFDFPDGISHRIKKDTSDYVHPMLPLKLLATLEIEDLAQRLYEDCGMKNDCLNHFLEKWPLFGVVEAKKIPQVREQVEQLIEHDLQCIMHFGDLFMQIIKSFTEKFVR